MVGLVVVSVLLTLIAFMFWAQVHYLLGARTYLRDLEAKDA